MGNHKSDWYFYSSLICAIWFATSSWAWTYLANLFISFPFGLLSFIIWQVAKRNDPLPKRYMAVKGLLLMGIMSAAVVGIILLAAN